MIELEKIKFHPNSPRKVLDKGEIETLAMSIKKCGLRDPIRLRRVGEDFEVIHGKKRVLAFIFLGRKELQDNEYSLEDLGEGAALVAAGIDTVSPGKLDYLEEGEYFKYLLENHVEGINKEQDVADTLGVSRKNVNLKINVLRGLYPNVFDFLRGNIATYLGKISYENGNIARVPMLHAFELTRLQYGKILTSEKKKIDEVLVETFTDTGLLEAAKKEFEGICNDIQLSLCKETADRNLGFKKFKRRVENEVDNISKRLEDVVEKERNKKCWYMCRDDLYSVIYNKDSRLILNDFNKDVKVFDEKQRKFGSVSLVVTSPPYFQFGKEYETAVSLEDYLQGLWDVFTPCIKILEPGGKFVINVADKMRRGGDGEYVAVSAKIIKFMQDKGMKFLGPIVWKKGLNFMNNPNVTKERHGDYLPLLNWEYVLPFRKPGEISQEKIEKYETLSRKTFGNEEWVKFADGVWTISPVSKQKDHPAMFPVELAHRMINGWSFVNDVVLDPFGGSMTTGVATRKLKRHFVGYDVVEKYCQLGRKKIENLKEDANEKR